MRRIGALLFSTEHLLLKLIEPYRIKNNFCEPLRDSKLYRLGQGDPSEKPGHDFSPCLDYLAADIRHGEEPISWRTQNDSEDIVDAFRKTRQHGYKPFQVRDDNPNPSGGGLNKVEDYSLDVDDEIEARIMRHLERERKSEPSEETEPVKELIEPSRKRNIRRIVNSWPTAEQLERYEKVMQKYTHNHAALSGVANDSNPPSIFECIHHIFDSAASSCEVTELLGSEKYKMVNFTFYSCYLFNEPRQTIEFRGAGGNLSDWVVTWAKICVGLTRFAISAPPEDFLDVLINCDRSMKEEGIYDVIDLLDDIGLPAEAAAAEEWIQAHEEEFEIEYFDPESKQHPPSDSEEQPSEPEEPPSSEHDEPSTSNPKGQVTSDEEQPTTEPEAQLTAETPDGPSEVTEELILAKMANMVFGWLGGR